MVQFKFNLASQEEFYKKVKEKLNTHFYQNLHFYILPYMPEKFRNRVVFLPETFDPVKIYKKQRKQIELLGKKWKMDENNFLNKLEDYFPKLNTINITISPSLYGSLGSYTLKKNEIIVSPRYDRDLLSLQKLLITSLTHYFQHGHLKKINKEMSVWTEKQTLSKTIHNKILPIQKSKSILDILDTEFAGRYAEESATYLERVRQQSKNIFAKPKNLTKKETIIFNLLLRNKNKLVSFDEMANWLWEDKSEEKFSEYAITKLIERLKKKIPKNIIHSQRGTGYILHV
jgi:hypothetical protein